MSIYINEEKLQFQLNAGNSSYVFGVRNGYLTHYYWGKKLENADHSYMSRIVYRTSFNANDESGDYSFSLDTLPLEYPCFGRSDSRIPAIEVINSDGSNIIDLKYSGFIKHNGKLSIDGLPATYTENEDDAQTLEIILKDEISNVEVSLFYGVFEKLNVISRWSKTKNNGENNIKITRALSACVDFDNADFNMISNYGAWGRERMVEEKPLFNGVSEIYSRRGSSSHSHNPFFILKQKNADENAGEVFGFSFVYSGSFKALVDVDSFKCARAMIGLNPDGFSWTLEKGQEFSTPEANMVFSSNGVGEMSRTFHSLYRDNLCRGKYKNIQRPVLVNTWEACYFDFDENKVEAIAKESAKLGIDLVVVDDGWFGKRDDDTTSLGDWFYDKNKLPNGLEGLAKKVNDTGCKLGIWFEPEMINPVSELYKNHPEWVLKIQGRPSSLARKQLMLDMSRSDVQEYLFNCIADVIKAGNIEYIKWDFNRNLTEVGSLNVPADRQGEVSHRFVLGLYSLLERLVTSFPDVLFESCSGGGGRYDAGLLYYMPQTWTSDNTDAMKRLKIQYGTSLIYPLSSMSAHVSACPNHQTGVTSPAKTRKNVALTGSFGFELNPLTISEEESNEIVDAAKTYHELGDLLVNGDYYRLVSPYESNNSSWMYLSKDKSEAFVVVVNSEVDVNDSLKRVRLPGLEDNAVYVDKYSNVTYTSAQLKNYGLQINQFISDKDSMTWHLVKQS